MNTTFIPADHVVVHVSVGDKANNKVCICALHLDTYIIVVLLYKVPISM